tara:strand:+ start:73 stop:336 length:264 start_codon:yes stop_codon:yes gene_type:complete
MGRSNKAKWPAGEKPKPEDFWRRLVVNGEIKKVKPVLFVRTKSKNFTSRRYMAGTIEGRLVLDSRTMDPAPYKGIGTNIPCKIQKES